MKFATGELNSRKFVGLIIDDDKILDLQKAEKKLFELERYIRLTPHFNGMITIIFPDADHVL